ncbi:MAG: ATPase, T2SS/T4P/T4SS family [Planctomycetota bacterium]
MDDTRLGSILLESKVISEAELEKCLEIQSLTGNTRTVGQILLEQGHLDRATLDRLLQLQQTRRAARPMAAPQGPEALGDGSLLEIACRAGARELVISEGRPVMVREAASWRPLTSEVVRSPEVWEFVRSEMGTQVLEELADRHFVVHDLHRKGLCRGRITAMRHTDGVAVIAELRPETPQTLTDLGIEAAASTMLTGQRGLVLFVGERGEGRSELLAGVLAEMVKEAGRYVIVLDDALDAAPPEGGALVTRRRVGEHVADYASGLRTSVREDPDAILCGSLDEPQAFDLALRAAEGGRLVVGWMDATSVTGCLERALNFYSSFDVPRIRQSLATVLRGVCVRHLVPSKGGERMLPATELLVVDDAARDVLRAGDLQNLGLLMRTEGGPNGHSLDQSLCALAQEKRIRVEDAYTRAEEKAWLLGRLRGLRPEGVTD